MDLRQLRYFLSAAENENFHRAAELLNVAQPAISKQIRELEAWVGVELFERLPRGVRLTDAGRSLMDDARGMLDHLTEMRTRAREVAQGVRGHLRIGMNETGATCALASKIIRHFKASFPMIAFEIVPMHSQRLIEALELGEIHVGTLLQSFVDRNNLDYVQCSAIKMFMALCKGHRLAKNKAISVSDLDNESIVWTVYSQGELRRYMNLLNLKSENAQISPSMDITLQLVASEVGIAPVHEEVAQRRYPNVVFRPLKEQLANEFVCFAWRKTAMPEILKHFTDTARLVKAEIAPLKKSWR